MNFYIKNFQNVYWHGKVHSALALYKCVPDCLFAPPPYMVSGRVPRPYTSQYEERFMTMIGFLLHTTIKWHSMENVDISRQWAFVMSSYQVFPIPILVLFFRYKFFRFWSHLNKTKKSGCHTLHHRSGIRSTLLRMLMFVLICFCLCLY